MKYHLSIGMISGFITMVVIGLVFVFLFRRYRKFKKIYKDDFEGWI